MVGNWPIVVAVCLIFLKQFYKLYCYHKPDRIDYFKAAAILPLDISFLIVGLFIKAAIVQVDTSQKMMALFLLYLIFSAISAVLWRISENAIKVGLGFNFAWAFPLNMAGSASAFYLALQYVG